MAIALRPSISALKPSFIVQPPDISGGADAPVASLRKAGTRQTDDDARHSSGVPGGGVSRRPTPRSSE